MHTSLQVIVTLLDLVPLIAAIPSFIGHTRSDNFTRLPPSVSTYQQELGPRLSKNATLYFPNSPGYINDTERWAANTKSNFSVVVVPGTAQDVAATVSFADTYNVPFLAVNKGHGGAAGLATVYNGIQIYIRALDDIEVSEDGNSASMGGGVYQDQLVNYLFDRGKAASSGACACTGVMGPGLGGGFGRFSGYYGLVLDSIIELDVVLANGSMITVSESSHSDLFWGMRGAGHNFGIVTRFSYKIYDIPHPDWFFSTMTFTNDKLEAVFQALNTFGANGTQPKEAVTYTLYTLNPEISATEPVVIFVLQFGASAAEAAPILAPFFALNPISATNETVPYTGAAHAAGAGVTDATCLPGVSAQLYPVGLQTYNISTNRAIYNLYKTMVNENPGLNTSIVQFEGYAQQGIRAVEPDSTAYAHRGDSLLVSYGPIWSPSEPGLAAVASDYGHQARTTFHAGEPGRTLNTYVNYASSDETPEMLYGYEPWRLERLRKLKSEYDPKGKFNFYNPIR